MKSVKIRNCPLVVLSLFFLSMKATLSEEVVEPNWRYGWQRVLVDYLKSIKEVDVKAEVRPIDPEMFEPGAEMQYLYLLNGETPLATFAAGAAKLPEEDFTWSRIWRAEEESSQAFLKEKRHEAVKKGELWIPAHPTTANILAWMAVEEGKWNPYRGEAALKKRAAIISMVDLLGWTENSFYYNDEASSKEGRKWGLHTGVAGFALTFNAFTFLKVADALPEKARSAWVAGLKHMCEEINKSRPTGPSNMRLSIPVGLYYAWLGTRDERIHDLYEKWLGLTVFGDDMSLAGHHWEGGGRAPDGSYNGIAQHRLAELYSVTKDPNVLEFLRRGYELKNYLTVPEPDGSWLSPSHFNDRCQSSFANDQYQGRETQFVTVVPESVPWLRRYYDKQRPVSFDAIARSSARPSSRVAGAFPWGGGEGAAGRMHDWGNVLHLPDYLYQASQEEVQKALAKNYQLPVLSSDNFTRSFEDEFHCVRRPAYYAMFYTGQAVKGDDGSTNYRSMLKNKGGLFNGFAGGGLSAFWTPAGAFMLGRMNAHENYERQEVMLGTRSVKVPGWRDWANNHLIGETAEGKILSSARTSWPESKYDEEKQQLTIGGVMASKLKRAGTITDVPVHYERRYRFAEDRLFAELSVTSEASLQLRSFYETLPIQITDDLKVSFYDESGKLLESAELVKGVKKVELARAGGKVAIVFEKAQSISQLAQEIQSKQATLIRCRNLQVQLPQSLPAGEAVGLRYQLVPEVFENMSIPVTNALKYPSGHEFKVPDSWVYAHFSAEQGVESDREGRVISWKDSRGKGLTLRPMGEGKAVYLKSNRAVKFDGESALVASMDSEEFSSLSIMTVVRLPADEDAIAKNRNGRILSMTSADGNDHPGGFSLTADRIPREVVALREHYKHYRKAIAPTAIGMGRALNQKDGELVLSGSARFTGAIMELYLFRPKLPEGYGKIMEQELRQRYKIEE